ncbi:SCO3242 family prenyltransferase [Nocardioides sp. 1609]|uniref:SCO3242 family prenyltransferase n=1 Tax=Nocardioides sp. 1609 TaxID=2508327 RepID=UPI001ADBFE35|nr:UbiA family prenyltransferase [Nocardioides sp. 1609]
MAERPLLVGLADLAELVRAPAALSVPGDTLAGAAAGGTLSPASALMPLASICLYWSGMALNDYADRALDAVERPERPIPSGRVAPGTALGIAAGLTVAGVTTAALAGGRPAARTAVLLTAAVWSYDLVLKNGPAGPAAMAAARGLDVLLGAGRTPGAAAAPALLVAAHTAGVTALSRGEVHGTRSATAASVTAVTGVVAGLTAWRARGRGRGAVLPAVLAATYAVAVGRAQARAVSDPSAPTVRTATGAGIRGLVPLQAGLLAGSDAPRTAVALLAAAPAAAWASKVVSPT